MSGAFMGLKELLSGAPSTDSAPLTLEVLYSMFRDLWDNSHGHPDLDDPSPEIWAWYAEHNKTCKDPSNPTRHRL